MQPNDDAPAARPPAWQVAAGTALAYAAVGWVAMLAALPPGYASPLFPSAGIALVAALLHGRAALAGVFVGSFLVAVLLTPARGADDLALLAIPLAIAAGSLLQAGIATALIRRFVPQPLVLDSARDVALTGLLGGPLACIAGAAVANAALWATGALSQAQVLPNAVTWWAGDALGVMIGGPLAMTLVGRPERAWRPRRRTVALPLLVVTLLLVGVTLAIERDEQQRLAAEFDRDASALAADAANRLQAPEQALQAVAAAQRAAAGRLDAATLDDAARWWTAQPIGLLSVSWSERVPRSALPDYEARVRAAGDADFTVYRRGPEPAGDAVVLRLVTPQEPNRRARGVDSTTIPAVRAALEQARDTGRAAASSAFRPSQAAPGRDDTAILVVLPVYDGPAADAASRSARFRGALTAAVRVDALLAGLPATQGLDWCLVDPTADGARVAGPVGCESATSPLRGATQRVGLAGRPLELRVTEAASREAARRQGDARTLAIVGLAAASLLGALLLTVTGRAHRIELAVDERSAELRREVAERRRAEEEMRAVGERLQAIVDAVPIGVMFLDLDGRLLEANPWLCTMLDCAPGALVGRTIDDITHADDRPANHDCIQTLLGGRAPIVRRRTRLLRDDGQALPARTVCTLQRDAAGRPWRLIGVAEDISDHLRLEESERALARAEAANRAKTEFLSRMSHELRTPLNAMIGFAQLLGLDREPALAPHQRGWATQMLRAGWHLLAMINDTLDLARLDAGSIQLDVRPQDLGAAVAASIEMVAAVAERQGVTVDAEIARDAVGVLADDTRLKQVLTNLLSNAVKYNRPGGSVVVGSATAPDGRVVVRVRDTGLGMTPEQLAQLFQPYNRLGREQSGIEGTGIGLVISRRLAELMGGTLEASSVAGRGSEFVLTLPRAEPAGAAAPSTISLPLDPYAKRRVHYIEDNETNVEVMRGVLAQRPQIALEVSTMGLDGLAAVRQRRPHLILLDMHLPDISGLELLRHLKQDPDVADVPVIVVSADATKTRMEDALTLGAAHYVTKPLDVRRFLRTVDEALASHETRWGL